jgi:DNA-binding MarR family transcriptional regulator
MQIVRVTNYCAMLIVMRTPDTAVGATDTAEVRAVELELAASLRLVINRLARRLRGEVSENLSQSLLSALVSIELHGPITLGHLAEREHVKPPSVTRLVAELEERGLVRRETDPIDHRVARACLTAKGQGALRHARSRKTAYLAERLRALNAAELTIMHEALPVLERLLADDR